MEKLGVLISKSKRTVKDEGIKIFLKKTSNYLRQTVTRRRAGMDGLNDTYINTYVDVLFINGCMLPHPPRYRVSHQREQLLAGNMTSNEVFYDQLKLEYVKCARVFIFFRCPYTDTIGEFIKLAKEYNKTVLFDVDDLVIDTRYTNKIKYVTNMPEEDKKVYDEGVELIGKTLKLCDGAITTTERLAKELEKYVDHVYINRNVASDRMEELSELAIRNRENDSSINIENRSKLYEKNTIKLGYFSGSITHNEDFELILPVIRKIMLEHKNVEMHMVGELDVPKELEEVKDRIVASKFVDWQRLPQLIASIDINIAPLVDNIFNEAKSENKWIEAALVKIPTIASNVGAFKTMIQNNETGMLCSDESDWYKQITLLIENKEERDRIAQNAYRHVKKYCTTVYTGYKFTEYIRSVMKPNIAFILPTLSLSGGSMVVKKHALIFKKAGHDVLIISEGFEKPRDIETEGEVIPALVKSNIQILGSFDKAVATLWSTLDFLSLYPNIRERYYLVQGYETDFSKPGSFFRFRANQTYNSCICLNYITISRWCERWLKEDYGKEARYARNGINLEMFRPVKRKMNGKVRILIEGNADDPIKNVDESFAITEQLDPEKFEIWYMSYQGKPQKEYHIDRFLHQVPHEKVPSVYRKCDILIKSSIQESFSYPPLEMIATGGYVVVAPNDGNIEYLKDGYNCLFYEHNNLDNAIEAIKRICTDRQLQDELYKNGIDTAKQRDWNQLTNEILQLYVPSHK